jgi:DNA modification methylase
MIDDWTQDIHQGDVVETLAEMPESSVHMAMCSPPYYGLRDYGEDGQIGLEESLDEYIQNLVDVGEELRRVLRPDGSWWLNLGDSYAGDKNKMLVPHRTAIALKEAGWIVRNDVTWVKPNPMPQSVKDRLNTTTEQVFHLPQKPDYWYDLDAIREQYSESMKRRAEAGYKHKHGGAEDDGWEGTHHRGGLLDKSKEYGDHMNPAGKNPGDVFEVTTKPFPDAHFAVYPPELCEKPIKATAPPKVCAACGAPYERDVEREPGKYDYSDRAENVGNGQQASGTQLETPTTEHVGWDQTCDCDTDDTQPGIVLDPFAGAGTTCLVAKRLGRRFVGIDLNPEYVAMAQKRVGVTVDEPERLLDENETALTEYS